MSSATDSAEIAERLSKLLNLHQSSPAEIPHISIPLPRISSKDEADVYALAKANQQYYLERAAKTGQPWLTLPRHPYQYSEFILTTPAMAQAALDRNRNPRKRLKPHLVKKYSRDVMAGSWIPTHESIGIDLNGYVFDGQHRMHASIAADKPCIFYWTFNALVEARFAVDQGSKRSTADKLDLVVKNSIGSKLPAICRALMRGINTDTYSSSFSDAEIAHVAARYGTLIEEVSKALPKLRSDALAPIVKAVLYYGEEEMRTFIATLSSLSWGENDGHPCKRLYLYLKNTKGVSGTTVYKKTLSAIEHYRNKTEIRALYERTEDIFEWGNNWTIPAKV